MMRIHTKEDLQHAINMYFSSKREFIDTFNVFFKALDSDVLGHQLAGRRGFTKWHKAAYTMFFRIIELSDNLQKSVPVKSQQPF